VNGSYLIINAFSARNAGDAAIVLATAAVLRENGAAEIRSATRYFEQDREFYAAHNIEVVPPLVPFAPRPGHGSSRWRVLSFFAGIPIAFAVVALSRFTPARARRLAERLKRAGVMELLAADRVIICGGGYLYSARGALNLTLVHVILSTKLSQLARKDPLMMPQSVGPLPRHLDRVLVSWGFSKVRPIVARDEIAYREAREILPPSAGADIHVCPDIAFVRWPSSRPSGSPETQKARVGIVAMDWTWARRVDRRDALDRYVAKLADVARA